MLTSKTIRNASLVMLFTGLCASSASVILPLLQEHYDLSYDFSNLNPSAHVIAYRHQNNMASNVTFFDGHVETKTAATLNPYNSANMWGSGNLNMRQYVAYDN